MTRGADFLGLLDLIDVTVTAQQDEPPEGVGIDREPLPALRQFLERPAATGCKRQLRGHRFLLLPRRAEALMPRSLLRVCLWGFHPGCNELAPQARWPGDRRLC